MRKNRHSYKNLLVKRYLENVSRKAYRCALGRDKRGVGIYVLYKGKRVYYIGKTTSSLRGRLSGHLGDRHKGKWDRFSIFQVKRVKYIRDLEVLLLHIFKPKGNVDRGRFRSKYDLKKAEEVRRCLLARGPTANNL